MIPHEMVNVSGAINFIHTDYYLLHTLQVGRSSVGESPAYVRVCTCLYCTICYTIVKKNPVLLKIYLANSCNDFFNVFTRSSSFSWIICIHTTTQCHVIVT